MASGSTLLGFATCKSANLSGDDYLSLPNNCQHCPGLREQSWLDMTGTNSCCSVTICTTVREKGDHLTVRAHWRELISCCALGLLPRHALLHTVACAVLACAGMCMACAVQHCWQDTSGHCHWQLYAHSAYHALTPGALVSSLCIAEANTLLVKWRSHYKHYEYYAITTGAQGAKCLRECIMLLTPTAPGSALPQHCHLRCAGLDKL